MVGNSLENNTARFKTAIIVGATSGIGLEVTRVLAARGWQIGIAGRRADRLRQLQDELQQVVAVKVIDVTDDGASVRLSELIEETGGMDLYFHSSGVGWQNLTLDVKKELVTVETNVIGFTRMVTAAFHYFETRRAGRGHIAVISSIAGTKGLGAAAAYSSTKRYQNHYMECLSQLAHIRGLAIDFTDIRPGFVATEMTDGGSYPMKMQADYVARKIVGAIEKRQTVFTVDWRYRILVFLWRLVPRWLWTRLKIVS